MSIHTLPVLSLKSGSFPYSFQWHRKRSAHVQTQRPGLKNGRVQPSELYSWHVILLLTDTTDEHYSRDSEEFSQIQMITVRYGPVFMNDYSDTHRSSINLYLFYIHIENAWHIFKIIFILYIYMALSLTRYYYTVINNNFPPSLY